MSATSRGAVRRGQRQHGISVIIGVRRPGISAGRLRAVIAHTLQREGAPPGARLSVALISDAAIRDLNRRFLRRDRPTDVLAFPGGAGEFLGDVGVSVDRARAQARTAGHAQATEIALLATHGVLHLLGYRDHTAAARARMMRRQEQLLREVGMRVHG